MTHAEFRYRLLLTGGVSLVFVTIGAALLDSGYIGDLFVAAAVFFVGAIVVMPAPRRGKHEA